MSYWQQHLLHDGSVPFPLRRDVAVAPIATDSGASISFFYEEKKLEFKDHSFKYNLNSLLPSILIPSLDLSL